MSETTNGTAVAPAKIERAPVVKERVGRVVSDKMSKTIIVAVERRVPHARYGKMIRKTSRFYAHDEEGKAKVGDQVRIRETRPLSKLKRWQLVEIVAERGPTT